jgi:hypothetical protein
LNSGHNLVGKEARGTEKGYIGHSPFLVEKMPLKEMFFDRTLKLTTKLATTKYLYQKS